MTGRLKETCVDHRMNVRLIYYTQKAIEDIIRPIPLEGGESNKALFRSSHGLIGRIIGSREVVRVGDYVKQYDVQYSGYRSYWTMYIHWHG